MCGTLVQSTHAPEPAMTLKLQLPHPISPGRESQRLPKLVGKARGVSRHCPVGTVMGLCFELPVACVRPARAGVQNRRSQHQAAESSLLRFQTDSMTRINPQEPSQVQRPATSAAHRYATPQFRMLQPMQGSANRADSPCPRAQELAL